ncbi:MAG: type II toxin-antitoxin system Phd/YefM family antitoxin [Caulobacterales bacterium]|nr:type II toxin-antitoxin system Phd/YefM family antitoxin [Caulobacterales bacterium]
MAPTILSSREFKDDPAGARKVANRGPVIITDKGRPAYVLLTLGDYLRLVEDVAKLVHPPPSKG